jgi:hypothetical protein
MPLIYKVVGVFERNNTSFTGVFDAAVDGRESFGVFLFREFWNGMIESCFSHSLSIQGWAAYR